MLSSFTVISVLFSFVSIYFQKAWFFNISVKKKLKEYCINDRNLLVMKTFRKEITVSNVFICEVYHDLTEQFCILIMSIIVFFFFSFIFSAFSPYRDSSEAFQSFNFHIFPYNLYIFGTFLEGICHLTAESKHLQSTYLNIPTE